MENRPLAVRLLVILISLLLFVVSAAGAFLLVDDYVSQKDWPTKGSLYEHLLENVDFYRGVIGGSGN